MSKYKIPERTAKRKAYMQTTAVEIQMTVACPICDAKAGYYCSTDTGNKSAKYHQKRFEAYIDKHRI